jgi:hypothetical protein
MTVKEIKIIAKKMGLKAGKMKKADLVRTIQSAEGNTPCFQTGVMATCGQESCCWRVMATCGQESCCWRSDCM